ncbi:MAG: hypothetical protein N3H30_02540 [Candidatus Micrarchaeota archaeon]|nr:hypothetical protein [Candidatus Micrarchaeota archaeon]
MRLLDDLNEHAVIVEGKRDVAALSRIGVRACVMTLDRAEKSGTPPGMPAVVLTDFDRSGEIKAAKAEALLVSRGVRVNNALRTKFRRIFGTLTIEDVPYIFGKLLGK